MAYKYIYHLDGFRYDLTYHSHTDTAVIKKNRKWFESVEMKDGMDSFIVV